MFELGIAFKYLIPRKKSLSTALISLMSIFVISLVIWLVLIFLSVTAGIERNWLKKLTALHAPIRIAPTDAYYSSYYYQVDSISVVSNYTLKTIQEKANSTLSDPYSPEIDMEVPTFWPKDEMIDPVKTAFSALAQIPEIIFQDYEIAGALLRLNRSGGATLSQMAFLLSYPDKNPDFQSLILESKPLNTNDISILLPKSYKDNGIKTGDRGSLCYMAPTSASSQEQKIAIRVGGFYDPGFHSIGNKCIIVPPKVTQTIHAVNHTFSPDGTPTNGIFVWVSDLKQTDQVQKQIELAFKKANISKYWKIDNFRNFEFAKDLMLQFQSDKTLFLLIAGIILLVACCNIISLLVLLVNDKKKEIAILQSMGASFQSIALIFGFCGICTGLLSCLLGTAFAIFTLHNLHHLVGFLSAIQGRAAFNPAFFGQNLPNELSGQALLFVLILTPILSFLAGLIPAIKAYKIRPSSVLRAE